MLGGRVIVYRTLPSLSLGMVDHCCAPPPLNLDPYRGDGAYRRVLWAVLAINAVMFVVEIGAGLAAGSASLQADALDFLGDAANYTISLVVVGMALRYRAAAALAKGATMGLIGIWVIGTVIWHARARHASEWPHNGRGRCHGTRGERNILRTAVGLPSRRRQHALGLDLHAQ
jgi:hypothetical protein